MILTPLILLLALFGGLQAYTNPIITVGLGAAGLVTMLAACVAMRTNLAIRPYLWPVCLALAASFLANLDIFEVSAGRAYLYATALAALLVAARWVTAEQLFSGLLGAGWLFWALYAVFRPDDNQNIVAVWPALFILVGLAEWQAGGLDGPKFAYFGLNLGLLLYLGSRGAVLGLAAGASVFFILTASNRKEIVWGLGLVWLMLAGLMAYFWRYETALNRLHYWKQAGAAFLANPVFGVGPGGLRARELITEPGGGFQLHGHNLIVTTTAELGLVGLAALALTGFTLYVQRSTFNLHPWQAAIVTALLCHSLVDEPLFWPGPMLLAALVAGTMTRKEL